MVGARRLKGSEHVESAIELVLDLPRALALAVADPLDTVLARAANDAHVAHSLDLVRLFHIVSLVMVASCQLQG